MYRRSLLALGLLWLALPSRPASAFCGFYVAKADTRLFNRASQVALVRHGDHTTMTMANDFKGDLKEFAMVVPVPTVLRRDQIQVADKALLDHLDAYSAPRLVEYHDPDPCLALREEALMAKLQAVPRAAGARSDRGLGVTVEARYTVGEYDILILSAEESGGLETWLRRNGYRVPAGASRVLGSYVRQGLKFFVARVNLAEQSKLAFSYLRPLQISYESPKFMLPIRLGTVNANGPQELFVYALTRGGRVETTNYRTVRLPSGMDLPLFVRAEFPDFYRAMFSRQVEREDMSAVFLEYAWDMGWCDPCSAEPLSADELKRLGVSWGPSAFLTRLHVRYDGESFPQDLVFQETGDRESFQGRFVLRNPWRGEATCAQAAAYQRTLAQRREEEAVTLASLTGWKVEEIRRKMGPAPQVTAEAAAPAESPRRGWRRFWPF
jgi:hypothetical protein